MFTNVLELGRKIARFVPAGDDTGIAPYTPLLEGAPTGRYGDCNDADAALTLCAGLEEESAADVSSVGNGTSTSLSLTEDESAILACRIANFNLRRMTLA